MEAGHAVEVAPQPVIAGIPVGLIRSVVISVAESCQAALATCQEHPVTSPCKCTASSTSGWNVQVGVTLSVAWLAVMSSDGGDSLPSWLPSRLLWTRSGASRPRGRLGREPAPGADFLTVAAASCVERKLC